MHARDRLDAGAGVDQRVAHVLALRALGLEGEQARHDGEAVLDPVAHLPRQQVLPGELRLEEPLRALALDGAAEEVCEALHEGDVRLLEHTLAAVVHLQHAEGAVPVLDDHGDRPADAVLGHELGRAEAGLVLEMVRDDGPARLQGEARGRGAVGADARLADHIRPPADARPHEQPPRAGPRPRTPTGWPAGAGGSPGPSGRLRQDPERSRWRAARRASGTVRLGRTVGARRWHAGRRRRARPLRDPHGRMRAAGPSAAYGRAIPSQTRERSGREVAARLDRAT
ncbi:hypothetical protein LDDCCGHA_1935 [Methylobacterium oxalidis]|nr:hypothetical protein LDDCCGHA_1935 [Methylobacterium oxalidis]